MPKKSLGSSYKIQHRAPGREGAPLHDVTQNEVYPRDFYERSWEYVHEPLEREAAGIVLAKRNKPDRSVVVCRAVPKGVKTINPGDWVSTVRKYAREHGRGNDPTQDMPVICARAKAADLHTEGNSLLEWGYNGPVPLKGTIVFRPKTKEQLEKAKAAAQARRQAAKRAAVMKRHLPW